jgi:hypothetical protein
MRITVFQTSGIEVSPVSFSLCQKEKNLNYFHPTLALTYCSMVFWSGENFGIFLIGEEGAF